MLFSKDGTELICYAGPASAVIPDSAEVIGKAAFFGNSAVKNVTFNSKLKSIGDYSFSGCFGLEAVKLPLGVKSLGKGSFMNCSSLKQAILGSGLTSIPEECFSMCTVLSAVNIGPAISEIGSGAFFSCYKLSGIELPATVKKIGADAAGTHHNILSGENTAVHGFYISGEEGSAAEKYARSSGVDFIDFAAVPYGDVDGDGSVDASDASSVLREYALTSTGNPPTFTFYQKLTGDFDCDGAVNSLDASRILAYYAENATQH